MKTTSSIAAAVAASCVAMGLATEGRGGDWPMWGGSNSRNMVADAKDIPIEIEAGEFKAGTEEVDMATTKNILWAAKLGSQSYGTPTIAGGRVFVGTNNESPRDPTQKGDRGVLMCFAEKDGAFLWQLIIPKLGAGKVSDWEYVGLCSSPTVVGDRGWVVSNRGELICLDLKGLGDGNDGPFKDEAVFMSADGKPVELSDQHADILWVFDMRKEVGTFPHNVSSCFPLVHGGRVYVATSNGVDWSHKNIPAPFAPALIALDMETGELVGEEASGVTERVLHASWSSPALGKADDQPLILWGGGDGFCYAFKAEPVKGSDGLGTLEEVWRYDCNPPEYRTKDGAPIKYATYGGPSEIIGTAVYHAGRVFVAIGQDPEHGDGVGMVSCVPADAKGDITGKAAWVNKDVGRTISTASVHDGLVYIAEYDGDIHCLDEKTGESVWVHPTDSRIWSSTLVADGKVFTGTEDGAVVALAAGREKKLLGTMEFGAPVYGSPVVANGVLYVCTQTHLYAIGKRQ